MDIELVKKIALENGFKLKEQASGNMDLNLYVYVFAEKLLEAKQAEINELKAKLEAAQVPEGFVLVPKEPTGKMISAGYESKEHINNLIVNYKAMIEAAQGEGHE